jgi:hypothetical protein
MTKERDYAYEALAEVTGTDMSAGRGELNAGLKSIREQSQIEDSYLLADEIHIRAKLYRLVMPDVMLTPTALAKHWLRVFEESEQRKVRGVNQHSDASCQTCNGDRFVLVALRKPVQSSWMREHGIAPRDDGIEEYAPCPDCGPSDVGFFRPDGTKFRTLDPAQVRERMT